MPSKYDYTMNGNNFGISSTLNRGALQEFYIDGDWTPEDDEMDTTFIVEASSQITFTLDPSKLRKGFEVDVIDKNGNGVNFTIDGSNFNGTTNLVGNSSISGATDEYTVKHLDPGEFAVVA